MRIHLRNGALIFDPQSRTESDALCTLLAAIKSAEFVPGGNWPYDIETPEAPSDGADHDAG